MQHGIRFLPRTTKSFPWVKCVCFIFILERSFFVAKFAATQFHASEELLETKEFDLYDFSSTFSSSSDSPPPEERQLRNLKELNWKDRIGYSFFLDNPDLRDSEEVFACDKTHWSGDVCVMRGDIRFNGSARVITLFSKSSEIVNGFTVIKPYPMKYEAMGMNLVDAVTLRSVYAPKSVGSRRSSRHERNLDAFRDTKLQTVEMDGSDVTDGFTQTQMESKLNRKEPPERIGDATGDGLVSRLMKPSLGLRWRSTRHLLEENSVVDGAELEREMKCDVYYDVPGLLVSLGGFTGNQYHDINEVLVPIFSEVHHLKGNVILIFLQFKRQWFEKYEDVIRTLSNYPPLATNDSDQSIHCFSELMVGGKSYGQLEIHPSQMPHNETIRDFQNLFSQAWDDPEKNKDLHQNKNLNFVEDCRPQIALILRNGTRRIMNVDRLISLADNLGFRVLPLYPTSSWSLQYMWKMLRKSDIMIGVHGAAMTYIIFMQPGSVFVQIIPLGCDFPSELYYGNTSINLGLNYLPYKISLNESTLVELYAKNDTVLTNIDELSKLAWARKMYYFDKQDVRLNLTQFKTYLFKIKRMFREKPLRARFNELINRNCISRDW